MPNFFAPTFQVKVKGERLTADVSANVEDLSVVTSPNTLDTFHLTLANTYPRMRWTHTPDAELFQEGNPVTISFGYVDELEELFDGEITTVSPSFPSNGIPTLSIDGHTRLHWLQRSKKTRTFQKMTDKQIVEKIAQDNNLEPQVEDPGVTYDYVMQPNQTDLEFVRARAARIHYEVFVQAKTLIFRKMKEADEDIYTLVWGQPQQGLSGPNTFPLIDFTPSMNARTPTPNIQVRGYDLKTKQAIIANAGTSDQNGTMGGSVRGGGVWSNAFPDKEFVRVSTPVQTQAEAQEHAKAIYNNQAINMITGNGHTIGLPALRSGKVVKLEGLGPRFSGKYYLDQVTHTIGQGGYTTSFTVKRNATS